MPSTGSAQRHEGRVLNARHPLLARRSPGQPAAMRHGSAPRDPRSAYFAWLSPPDNCNRLQASSRSIPKLRAGSRTPAHRHGPGAYLARRRSCPGVKLRLADEGRGASSEALRGDALQPACPKSAAPDGTCPWDDRFDRVPAADPIALAVEGTALAQPLRCAFIDRAADIVLIAQQPADVLRVPRRLAMCPDVALAELPGDRGLVPAVGHECFENPSSIDREELPDDEAAWREATSYAGALSKDIDGVFNLARSGLSRS